VIVRYFAQTYRKEVRGMVLVDALGSSIASLLGPVWWPRYAQLLNFPFGPSGNPPGGETIDYIGAIRALQRATPPRMPLAVISKTLPFSVPSGALFGHRLAAGFRAVLKASEQGVADHAGPTGLTRAADPAHPGDR
jgi:pimeloyl-ACP methyl ester carboxylesterase